MVSVTSNTLSVGSVGKEGRKRFEREKWDYLGMRGIIKNVGWIRT